MSSASGHLVKASIILFAVIAGACSAPADPPKASPPQQKEEEELPPPAHELALPEEVRTRVDQTFTGDFDGMVERRFIRAGVPFNRTFYFVDEGQPRGLSYEYLMLLEEELNRKLKTGNLKIHVVLLPMPRDQLFPALNAGRLDIVVAQLTVTPERQKLVDFSIPTRRDVSEVVVTGPGGPALTSVDDLSGQSVFVRKGSSYYASLQDLNARLQKQGRPVVDVKIASESLEDDDILEMVNAGLVPATVVDGYLADFWKQVFKDLTVHDTLTLRTGGTLAVAFRKNSPKLASTLNEFIGKHVIDSAISRVLNKRYLENTRYVTSAGSQAERKKFLALVELFRKYGTQYKFDFLLMAAQGYQESRLNQEARSHVGAIGVMQLMPDTGKEQRVGDVTKLEPNIHAGVKYMRYVRDQYFEQEPMDDLNKGLFTFASYNAGPGRIRQLRREAQKKGLDPNVWFGNVERIASERIGRETVTYVSNIFKYYIAYRLIIDEAERRREAKEAVTGGGAR
jgi:membrane-bound lytic murein transglycosylase MltF